MTEKWGKLNGYSDQYEVSSLGKVKNTVSGKILNQRLLKGYPGVVLRLSKGKWATRTVHSLVAEVFISERPTGMQINHKDGICTNNALENLEYVTPLQNIRHAWDVLNHGRFGIKNHASKLTWSDVCEIRKKYRYRKYGGMRLAREYGVTKPIIYGIIKNKSWTREQ